MSEPGSTSGGHRLNPFARREEFSSQAVLMYKITTVVSWLLFWVSVLYYTFAEVHREDWRYGRLWMQNYPTQYTQSSVMTSIYWIVLFILQLFYMYSLYMSNTTYVNASANLAGHFIANNLLLFGFIHLWMYGHFVLGWVLLVINFFNLSVAYFRHSTTPRAIHIGVLSGPLAWNFVALYWLGALAFGGDDPAKTIVAYVFIWGWLGYGLFFLVAYKDYTMGFAMSVLSFSTGVGLFLAKHRTYPIQWIFAFTIGALLFVLSLAVGMPGLLGRDPFPRGRVVSEDRERAPLLADD